MVMTLCPKPVLAALSQSEACGTRTSVQRQDHQSSQTCDGMWSEAQ